MKLCGLPDPAKTVPFEPGRYFSNFARFGWPFFARFFQQKSGHFLLKKWPLFGEKSAAKSHLECGILPPAPAPPSWIIIAENTGSNGFGLDRIHCFLWFKEGGAGGGKRLVPREPWKQNPKSSGTRFRTSTTCLFRIRYMTAEQHFSGNGARTEALRWQLPQLNFFLKEVWLN